MGFLYYRAGVGSVNMTDLKSLGFVHPFLKENDGITIRECFHGPDGGRGCLFAPTDTQGHSIAFDADTQEWIETPVEGIWCGKAKAETISLSSLRRPDALRGHTLDTQAGPVMAPVGLVFIDAESRQWNIPRVARLEKGAWIFGEPVERYRVLYELCSKWIAIITGEKEEPSLVECLNDALVCLAVNYRIGAAEASLLRMLTTDDLCRKICLTALDYQSAEAWADKKKRGESGEGPCIESGQTD